MCWLIQANTQWWNVLCMFLEDGNGPVQTLWLWEGLARPALLQYVMNLIGLGISITQNWRFFIFNGDSIVFDTILEVRNLRTQNFGAYKITGPYLSASSVIVDMATLQAAAACWKQAYRWLSFAVFVLGFRQASVLALWAVWIFTVPAEKHIWWKRVLGSSH